MKAKSNLLDLQNRGSILFLYSDKKNIFVIYHDQEAERMLRLVTDKQFVIESVHELKVPEKFLRDYTLLQWHKPTSHRNNTYRFSGAVVLDEQTHTFAIDEHDVLTVSEAACTPNYFKLLPMDSLVNLKVEFHIQKLNQLYAIGYDVHTYDQLFILVDITQDKVIRKYILQSDLGDVLATTINIDHVDNRVYIGGLIRTRDENRETVCPYFESFLMTPQ